MHSKKGWIKASASSFCIQDASVFCSSLHWRLCTTN
ncbi:MAG: hypothetical protein ACK4RX_01395 [Chitinophagaceae bacterium]